MNSPVSYAPLQQRAVAQFERHYGTAPGCIAQAPGRVNLIGEHTDYNDGFVLPCAIDRQTWVAARARTDRQVRVVAADFHGATDVFDLDAPIARRADAPWADHVRGMAWAMRGAGHALTGADLLITGDVPQGAGLSSSASLALAIGHAFEWLAGQKAPEATALARLAQRSENTFVGVQCGIMDQLISAQGLAGHALLIDCRSLDCTPVALPEDVAVLIVHSGVQRGLVGSEYNLRRQQCEQAARHAQVPALRDLDLAGLMAAAARIPLNVDGQQMAAMLPELALRRARHVVSENARTLAAATALAAGDVRHMGELMAASHASMRDDFEITTPAIDGLVRILAHAIGPHGGARMTGGGFGGCVVALMLQARLGAAQRAVAAHYRAPGGQAAQQHVCRPSGGASAGAV